MNNTDSMNCPFDACPTLARINSTEEVIAMFEREGMKFLLPKLRKIKENLVNKCHDCKESPK